MMKLFETAFSLFMFLGAPTCTWAQSDCEFVQVFLPEAMCLGQGVLSLGKGSQPSSATPGIAPRIFGSSDSSSSETTTDCVKNVEEYDFDNDGTIDERRTRVYGRVTTTSAVPFLLASNIETITQTLEDLRDTDVDGNTDYERITRYDDQVVYGHGAFFAPSFVKTDRDTTDDVVDTLVVRERSYDDEGRLVRTNSTTTTGATGSVSTDIRQLFYDERGNLVLDIANEGRSLREYDDLDRFVRSISLDEDGNRRIVDTRKYYGDSDLLFEVNVLNVIFNLALYRNYTYNEQGSIIKEYGDDAFITYDIVYTYASDGVTRETETGYIIYNRFSALQGVKLLIDAEFDQFGDRYAKYEETVEADGSRAEYFESTYSFQGIFSRRAFDNDLDGMIDEVWTATSTPVACPTKDVPSQPSCQLLIPILDWIPFVSDAVNVVLCALFGDNGILDVIVFWN